MPFLKIISKRTETKGPDPKVQLFNFEAVASNETKKESLWRILFSGNYWAARIDGIAYEPLLQVLSNTII